MNGGGKAETNWRGQRAEQFPHLGNYNVTPPLRTGGTQLSYDVAHWTAVDSKQEFRETPIVWLTAGDS